MVPTDRYLFVVDHNSHSIWVYSLERDWAFVTAIGSKGSGTGQFREPIGMCVYRDRLIVCDSDNFRLQFIDISAADEKDWRFDAPFGSEGNGKGQFEFMIDVCEAGGVLFVADFSVNANRVQTFTIAVNPATGALTLSHRLFIGGFERPRVLVASADGSCVFVAETKQIRCMCSPILCAFLISVALPIACMSLPALNKGASCCAGTRMYRMYCCGITTGTAE
jgi:hypothetical protein